MADYDLVVIGSGPGGYVAAIRAAQLGLRTTIVDEGEIGGVCLNWGCIPSKSLLRNAEILSLFHRANEFGIYYDNLQFDFGMAIKRSRSIVHRLTRGIEALLRKNQVDLVRGRAFIRDSTHVEVRESGKLLSTDNIVIATGAHQRTLPQFQIDGKIVMTSREALSTSDVPQSVLIIGGGATGCEFGYVYNTYGAQVTIVELMSALLPSQDLEISSQLERSFTKQGIRILTSTEVISTYTSGSSATTVLRNDGGEETLEVDRVLLAIGVQGNIDDLGLEGVGVQTNQGFVLIDDQMRTNIPNIFAIGDVTGKLLLAHVASAQGVTVAETLAGQNPTPLDYRQIPAAVYCQPQVASWGITEQEARTIGREVQIGRFPFAANGKALSLGETDGFAKIIVDPEYGQLLGAHLIGPEVTELIAELSMTSLLEGTAKELGWLVHAHPSLSEVIKEAALATRNEAIHI